MKMTNQMSDTIELMWGPQDGRTLAVLGLPPYVMVPYAAGDIPQVGDIGEAPDNSPELHFDQLRYVRRCAADCVELVHPYWYTSTTGRQ